jgi:N-acetylglucosaminyl-diphospho-decaprenol L-rhamnosyltransferase
MAGPAESALVDVVVVSYNSRATLRGCVESLAALSWTSVTVVDNASSDGSHEVVVDLPIMLIHPGRNGGFSYGCNRGAAAGTAPYVLLLNPDARIDAADLATLVRCLEVDSTLAVAAPRILEVDGRIAWSQRRFPALSSTFAQALFLQRLAPRAPWSDQVIRDPAAYIRPATPDWLSGACLLVRREALEAFGGLDEGFFLYSEDTDLCRRLRTKGWGVRYEPAATARHTGGASAPRHQTGWISARSRVRYARKHHGVAVAAVEAIGVALGALTHAAVWLHRPAVARGHVAAARAAFAAVRVRA